MTKQEYKRRRQQIIREFRSELKDLDHAWKKTKRRIVRRKTKGLSVCNAVRAVMPALASSFTIHDIQASLERNDPVLAAMIKRTSLATALGRMARAFQGFAILRDGRGKKATVFRKLERPLKEAFFKNALVQPAKDWPSGTHLRTRTSLTNAGKFE
jgi:hypothetical protein